MGIGLRARSCAWVLYTGNAVRPLLLGAIGGCWALHRCG